MPGGGAQGRNRTTDTVIFSHVLYQLSYLGGRGRPGSGLAKRRCYRGSGWGCPAGWPDVILEVDASLESFWHMRKLTRTSASSRRSLTPLGEGAELRLGHTKAEVLSTIEPDSAIAEALDHPAQRVRARMGRATSFSSILLSHCWPPKREPNQERLGTVPRWRHNGSEVILLELPMFFAALCGGDAQTFYL